MKKVVACVTALYMIMLFLVSCDKIVPSEIQTTKTETYMELYVSKEIPKNTIILNDAERIITDIEDGGDRWILTITAEDWQNCRDKAFNWLKQKITERFIAFGINASIDKLDTNYNFTYINIWITTNVLFDKQYFNSEIRELIINLKFFLYGNYQIESLIIFR